jgi:hypothetical protein
MRPILVIALVVAGCGVRTSATATSDGRMIHVDVKTNGSRVHVGSNVANPGPNGHAKFDVPSWKVGDVTIDVLAEDAQGNTGKTQVTVKHDPRDAFEFESCATGETGWVFRVRKGGSQLACGATSDGRVAMYVDTPSVATLTIDGQKATVNADGHATLQLSLWPHAVAAPLQPVEPFVNGDLALASPFAVHVERPGKPPFDESLDADLGEVASQLWLHAWDELAAGHPSKAPLAGPGIAWHRTWHETADDGVSHAHEQWEFVGAATAGEIGRVVATAETVRNGDSCGKYKLGDGKEVATHLELHDWTLSLVPSTGEAVARTFQAPSGCPQRLFLDFENPEVIERTPDAGPILAWLQQVSGQTRSR